MILYKYLPPERIDILQRNLIRYTPPGAFNDPFESSPHMAALTTQEELLRMSSEAMLRQPERIWDEISPEVKRRLSRETYERIVTMVEPAANRLIAGVVHGLLPVVRASFTAKADSRVGILALSERRDDLLMWAHYAAAHAGFIVGVESTHESFTRPRSSESQEPRVRKVLYSKARPSKPITELSPTDLFFTKSDDWKYEEEWRVAEPLDEAIEIIEKTPWHIHLFPLPAECVREVILGCRAAREFEGQLRTVLVEDRYRGVKLFRGEVDDRHFAINIVPMAL